MKAGNELMHLRGMSEPFGFTFNVLEKGTGNLLVHAVIFTSYEASGDDKMITFPGPEVDPRMAAFIQFCIQNYGKEARESLQQSIKAGAQTLNEMNLKIKQLKGQLKHVKS